MGAGLSLSREFMGVLKEEITILYLSKLLALVRQITCSSVLFSSFQIPHTVLSPLDSLDSTTADEGTYLGIWLELMNNNPQYCT